MKFPPVSAHKCFSYSLRLTKENTFDGSCLINEPGVVRCEIRKIGNNPEFQEFERQQNYAARPAGGEDLALEAEISLVSEELPALKMLRIGVPLSEVPGISDFTVEYSGAYFSLSAGGNVLDEEFPYGDPPGTPQAPCAPKRRVPSLPVKKEGSFHTWSPEGRNVWLGDVSLGYFNGELHLFYLLDRRHHRSRKGGGGHQWGHLVTKDFRHWRDDGCIIPFADQWQTYGTGTPFYLNGKITLAYGLHSERTLGPGVPPCGATLASSEDGVRFVPTEVSYDDLPENPSIYHQPDGSFILYSGYTGGSLKLLRAEKWPEFQVVCDDVAPSRENSPMRNNLDCPAIFEWHGRYFLFVGFSAMFSGEDPAMKNRIDLAVQGMDLYDGLSVPMVAPFRDDRRILAGWLGVKGWGGVLGLRELVWFSDGIPGIRWLDEAMPHISALQEENGKSDFPQEACFEFFLRPGEDFTVRFEGTKAVEFRVKADRRRVELADAGQKCVPTQREACITGVIPVQAVENIRNLDKPYTVRLMIRDKQKWDGCIIDVEIARTRTLIHYFEGIHLDHCRIVQGNPVYRQGGVTE